MSSQIRRRRAPWVLTELLVAASLTCVVEARAQQRQEPVFHEQIEVTEVLLDVLVTDKKGRVVTGLGPGDFVVREGDKEFEVTSAVFYGDPQTLAASGPGRRDRYFILFFQHDPGAPPQLLATQTRIARDVESWVRKELLPNDQVAVLGFDLGLWLHQDFTRDREAILAAVDDAVYRRAPTKEPSELLLGRLGDSPSLFSNLPQGRELRRETRRVQQTLELLARASEGIAGRKNLVLFSSGFGAASRSNQLEPDSREYRRMVESLNAANVSVYSLDVPTIVAGGVPPTSVYSTLRKIATDTGGEYFNRSASFRRPLREISEDNRGYYLIGYRSGHEAGASGYREVEVTTVDDSLSVRARRGYRYGPPLEDEGTDP